MKKIGEVSDVLQRLGFNLLLLLKVILILLAAYILERAVRAVLKRIYVKVGEDREDVTRYRFLRNATRFIVGIIALAAIIYSIPSFKHLAVTLFAGAGILVAILGLATQRAFSNIISGIFIVSFKPFRVGDLIQIGNMHQGVVEDITLRHTVIVNFENRRVIVPNAIISDETIINSTIRDEATCEFVEISISYESDIDKAMEIMRDEALAHPDCMDRRTADELEEGVPQVPVRLIAIHDSGLLLRAYIWAREPVMARRMHYDLNKCIKQRFEQAGIEVPYPHRTIVFKQGGSGQLNILTHEKGPQP